MDNNGAKTKGKYLLRAKNDKSNDVLVLSVIFKGKPTHHNLVRTAEGESFSLNKQDIGKTDVAEVCTQPLARAILT